MSVRKVGGTGAEVDVLAQRGDAKQMMVGCQDAHNS